MIIHTDSDLREHFPVGACMANHAFYAQRGRSGRVSFLFQNQSWKVKRDLHTQTWKLLHQNKLMRLLLNLQDDKWLGALAGNNVHKSVSGLLSHCSFLSFRGLWVPCGRSGLHRELDHHPPHVHGLHHMLPVGLHPRGWEEKWGDVSGKQTSVQEVHKNNTKWKFMIFLLHVVTLRESDMWQCEDRAQNRASADAHYHHIGRNNNNNNSQDKVFTLWDPPHPPACASVRVCRWVFNKEPSEERPEAGDELLSFLWTDALICMIAALRAHVAVLPRLPISVAVNLLSLC